MDPGHCTLLYPLDGRRPERLVYTHTGGATFQAAVSLDAEGAKTRLTARMVFPSARERDRVVEKFNAVEGLQQHLGRLEVLLDRK